MPTNALEPTRVELRCPNLPKRLLGVMRISNEEQPKIVEGNLLELACRDCRTVVEVDQGRKPKRVLHHFNVIGDLVASLVEW